MKKCLALLLVAVTSTSLLAADEVPQAVADMSELMTRIIQPTSDAVFYISRFPPEDDAAWRELENKTLMLAESANLLLISGYKRSTEQWLLDTLLMRDASIRAWQAAKEQDMDALVELNNDVYTSCENCHTATR